MSEMVSVVEYFQILAVAVLVGKVVLLSFIVTPILAKNLERMRAVRQSGSSTISSVLHIGHGNGHRGIGLRDWTGAYPRNNYGPAGRRRDMAHHSLGRSLLPLAADAAEQCDEGSA
jgi:hypothetical protein